MSDKYSILKDCFGYSTFREGQEAIIDALLAGRDTLAVMPTGAGKSLCYQIPALLGDGLTLVISPLVSLMKDQVMNLKQLGVAGAYINSTLTSAQITTVLSRAAQGQYKIIYVAPERLSSFGFQRFVQNAPIDYVAVDEAHCVSKWGQDFRPAYLEISPFIKSLPKRPVVGAFTATATEVVRDDMTALLDLREPFNIVTGFDRKNLFYEVRHPSDRSAETLRIVRDLEGKSGIVYCATRKAVEEVQKMLADHGIPAVRYHAGLDERERTVNQEDFVNDRKPVMVATNAFGMGIDKSNVSYVIHYNMPGDMESYYQEAGRAGRDGTPARCILLYGPQDVRTQLFFIEHLGEEGGQDDETIREQQELARTRLRQMYDYCFTNGCLRAYILGYFGEAAAEKCGYCGNCTRVLEQVDITIDAQKILSCVKRAQERWGVKVIVDILRGSRAAKLRTNGLDRLSTYGIMKDVPEQRVRDIIRFLIQEQYLASDGIEYPLLVLGAKAWDVLRDRIPLTALLPPLETRAVKKEQSQQRRAQLAETTRSALYERLKALRMEIAAEKGVPAFMVMTNATLADMSVKMPRDREEFLHVSGIGERKAQEYSECFLEAIRLWLSENE